MPLPAGHLGKISCRATSAGEDVVHGQSMQPATRDSAVYDRGCYPVSLRSAEFSVPSTFDSRGGKCPGGVYTDDALPV